MMTTSPSPLSLDRVRHGQIGAGRLVDTPFGERPLLYADYTASGRGLRQVEAVIERLMADYANPHTEDSHTGRSSGQWLREAQATIKRCVNAGPHDCLIATGAGATAAIQKLQQILGVAIPPASRERLDAVSQIDRPVVFIGPYEHHSNELSWRESLAEVVSIPLTACGRIDLDALDKALRDPAYAGRRKIGAFSAASNVTGIKSDVRALARLLHANGGIICLDCAASAPYLQIDMNPLDDPAAAIDAVYFSPHKFVGGPGASGVLVFKEDLYRKDLAPTESAGGTVTYVWKDGHDFIENVEARERPGTPGVPQIVRTALAMQIQSEIGFKTIHDREQAALERAFEAWSKIDGLEVLGPQDPEQRLGIVSFNVRDPRGGWIHPRLVTCLLNDLFGIQSRAGCSCAGPYGHDLLALDDETTQTIREAVLDGQSGLRPGWCRISLHWIMSEAEIDYLIAATVFLAKHAWRFVDEYAFDIATGEWRHREASVTARALMPTSILDSCQTQSRPLDAASLSGLRAEALGMANAMVGRHAECAIAGQGHLCPQLRPERAFSLPTR